MPTVVKMERVAQTKRPVLMALSTTRCLQRLRLRALSGRPMPPAPPTRPGVSTLISFPCVFPGLEPAWTDYPTTREPEFRKTGFNRKPLRYGAFSKHTCQDRPTASRRPARRPRGPSEGSHRQRGCPWRPADSGPGPGRRLRQGRGCTRPRSPTACPPGPGSTR